MPKYRDAPQATKAIKTMQWQLLDQQGKAVELRQDRLIKEGMQIGVTLSLKPLNIIRKRVWRP